MKKILAILITLSLVFSSMTAFASDVQTQSTAAGEEEDVDYGVANPRIEADSSMASGQKVTWDCIYYGSYPQTEIVAEKSQCGSIGRKMYTDDDYVIDATLYNKLKAASYDKNDDVVMNGVKYHRMNFAQTVYDAENGYTASYTWDNTSADVYHYFRYEKIKWRVLETRGYTALLLADQVLDFQKYNTSEEDENYTWSVCTLRSWLNGYSGNENIENKDYQGKGFRDLAFSDSERNMIHYMNITNADNSEYGTPGGETTADYIYLLSEADLNNESYGFANGNAYKDEARRARSTTFSRARGNLVFDGSYYYGDDQTKYIGNSDWWSRTPGLHEWWGSSVNETGEFTSGEGVTIPKGVRPAMEITLRVGNYENAGTVCSTDTADHLHVWSKWTTTLSPTSSKVGVKQRTCSICGKVDTATIGKKCGVNFKDVINKSGGKAVVKWTRNKKATGYQVQYSRKASFSGAKTKKIKSSKKTSLTLKLKKGKTYYVRVRSYKKGNYSGWSKAKKVKIRK